MSYAEAKQYISTAPISQFEKIAELVNKRQEELSIDSALRRADSDIKNGRVYTVSRFKQKHNLK
jgi:hypothetical protein